MPVIDNLARSKIKRIFRKIKKAYFESKLTENIGEPKGLWKSFKFLGLKFERSISDINYLENDFDVKDIVNNFSVYFSNLAKNLVSKLPNPSNKYDEVSVGQHYSHLGLTKEIDLLPAG